MSDIFHHKAHTGGPLPNICPECDIALAWADRDALKAELATEKANHTMDLASRGTEIAMLKASAEKLAEALKTISFAKPDGLDHVLDVTIIERAAKIAKQALAAYARERGTEK